MGLSESIQDNTIQPIPGLRLLVDEDLSDVNPDERNARSKRCQLLLIILSLYRPDTVAHAQSTHFPGKSEIPMTGHASGGRRLVTNKACPSWYCMDDRH